MTEEKITRAEWIKLLSQPGFDPEAYIIERRAARYEIVDEPEAEAEAIDEGEEEDE